MRVACLNHHTIFLREFLLAKRERALIFLCTNRTFCCSVNRTVFARKFPDAIACSSGCCEFDDALEEEQRLAAVQLKSAAKALLLLPSLLLQSSATARAISSSTAARRRATPTGAQSRCARRGRAVVWREGVAAAEKKSEVQRRCRAEFC